MSRGRRSDAGGDFAAPSDVSVETDCLLKPKSATNSITIENPLINVDVLYRFSPKSSLRTIQCHAQKKMSSPVQCTLIDPGFVLLNAKRDNWGYLISGRVEGWVHLDSSCFGSSGPLERVEKFYRYENWPGRSTFICGGRVMLGADARMFLATNVLIIGTMVLVCIAVLPQLTHWILYSAITFVLFTISFANFWLTAAVEPGIIPRNSIYKAPSNRPDNALCEEDEIDKSITINSPASRSPLLGNGFISATPSALRWKICYTCNLFRPPRAKHCSTCDNCVEIFDHHCPWVGQCVGKRNYKYFMYFLISTTGFIALIVLLTLLCGLACFDVLARSRDIISIANLIKTLFSLPLVIIALVSLTFGFWSIAPLLIYHLNLIFLGQTTNENVREIFKTEKNLFDQGCCKNFISVFCSETPPSCLPNMRDTICAAEYMNTIRQERVEAADL